MYINIFYYILVRMNEMRFSFSSSYQLRSKIEFNNNFPSLWKFHSNGCCIARPLLALQIALKLFLDAIFYHLTSRAGFWINESLRYLLLTSVPAAMQLTWLLRLLRCAGTKSHINIRVWRLCRALCGLASCCCCCC